VRTGFSAARFDPPVQPGRMRPLPAWGQATSAAPWLSTGDGPPTAPGDGAECQGPGLPAATTAEPATEIARPTLFGHRPLAAAGLLVIKCQRPGRRWRRGGRASPAGSWSWPRTW